jgi:hypothetical protein
MAPATTLASTAAAAKSDQSCAPSTKPNAAQTYSAMSRKQFPLLNSSGGALVAYRGMYTEKYGFVIPRTKRARPRNAQKS